MFVALVFCPVLRALHHYKWIIIITLSWRRWHDDCCRRFSRNKVVLSSIGLPPTPKMRFTQLAIALQWCAAATVIAARTPTARWCPNIAAAAAVTDRCSPCTGAR